MKFAPTIFYKAFLALLIFSGIFTVIIAFLRMSGRSFFSDPPILWFFIASWFFGTAWFIHRRTRLGAWLWTGGYLVMASLTLFDYLGDFSAAWLSFLADMVTMVALGWVTIEIWKLIDGRDSILMKSQ